MCYFERHKSGYKANVMSFILVYFDDTYSIQIVDAIVLTLLTLFLSITV